MERQSLFLLIATAAIGEEHEFFESKIGHSSAGRLDDGSGLTNPDTAPEANGSAADAFTSDFLFPLPFLRP